MKPKAPTVQIPGIYHRKVGDITVSVVSDGYLNGKLDILLNISQDEAEKMLTQAYRPARQTSVNTFLVFSKDRLALVDTGCGPYMGALTGRLLDNLAQMNVSPDDIDTVLLTHLHPDHVGGLANIETGEKKFPNAEILVHEKELMHWLDDDLQEAASTVQTMFFGPARHHIRPYKKDALRTFKSGEVFPGVHAIESPGHTPGHTAFFVESGQDQMIIWGDTIHIQEIQIPSPEVGVIYDADVELAAQSRVKLFERLASDEVLTAGMHINFPGFGRIRKTKTSFEMYQEPWVQDLI